VSVEGSATPPTQGNRRIDRVLAEDYLDGLRELPLAEVRRCAPTRSRRRSTCPTCAG
jgi:hypothetical protein